MFRIAFWAALIFTFTMAVIPMPELPASASDKLLHVLAFLTLTLLAVAAYPRLSLLRIGLWLFALGLLIELVQLIPALNREGDLLDLMVDALAIGVGLGVIRILRRFNGQRTSSADRRDAEIR